ncbi:Hpt domain-containing protein [Actinoplanes sp. CA-015351]|uniref:Hpt domain-containing protein n=1 Tax=Actinoplanes sp. CA-015351 TaxID=3239897 RepID=UPI003D95451E
MGSVAPPADHDARVAAVRARLDDITAGKPSPDELALLVKLLRAFAAKAPAATDELISVLENGGTGDIRERAHAFKGSAANIGATALSALCAGVEEDAREGIRSDPATTAQRLRDEVAQALRAVTEVADDFHA